MDDEGAFNIDKNIEYNTEIIGKCPF